MNELKAKPACVELNCGRPCCDSAKWVRRLRSGRLDSPQAAARWHLDHTLTRKEGGRWSCVSAMRVRVCVCAWSEITAHRCVFALTRLFGDLQRRLCAYFQSSATATAAHLYFRLQMSILSKINPARTPLPSPLPPPPQLITNQR